MKTTMTTMMTNLRRYLQQQQQQQRRRGSGGRKILQSSILKLILVGASVLYLLLWIRYGDQKDVYRTVESTAKYLSPLPATQSPSKLYSLDHPKFRILCTSDRKRVEWGSYKLRCRDWKDWIQKCARNVRMTVGTPIETMYAQGVRRETSTRPYYNATVSTKVIPKTPLLPQFGNFFVDLVDDYIYTAKDVPSTVQLITQTEWQGREVFPHHNSTAVEHWYNSYPDDMFRTDPEVIPPIRVLGGSWWWSWSWSSNDNKKDDNDDDDDDDSSTLRLATIWNTLAKDTMSGCPSVENMYNVRYDCIEQEFDILDWYSQVDTSPNQSVVVKMYMDEPKWGAGRLYYHLFRKYDVMVVPAKNHPMKLKYGNVQRAVSQMRSGVPVLLEVWGEVMEDFMSKYGYKCAFARHEMTGKFPLYQGGITNTNTNTTMVQSSFWTWEQAIEELKKAEVRRECQQQGLEIVKDYSPTTIGKKFLRAVGYDGPFEC
jgi:hypothetical protein